MTFRQSLARRYPGQSQASRVPRDVMPDAFRSRWVLWVASTVMLMVLGATLAYWLVALRDTLAKPVASPATAPVVPAVDQARRLFGGELNPGRDRTVRLAGVLVLREGAAAILSVGDAPARAISSGAEIAPGMRLVAVRARSITIEHNGIQSEVMLPQLPAFQAKASPTIYVR